MGTFLLNQEDIELRLPVPERPLSRRSLFRMGGLGLLGATILPVLGGDQRQERREIPQGLYRFVVGMGDSYTAGLGASDLDHNYFALVAKACGAERHLLLAADGWSAEDMMKGKNGVSNQIDMLPSDADLILATIGGNAINLREFGNACLTDGCGEGTPAFSLALSIFQSNEFYDSLKKVYSAMLNKAPHATVAIVGYPKPINPLSPLERGVLEFLHIRSTAFGEENDEALANVVDMLNAASEASVRVIDNPRLLFLPPVSGISINETEFGSLGLARPQFHADNQGGSTVAGHPTDDGYRSMADAIIMQLSVPVNSHEFYEAASQR